MANNGLDNYIRLALISNVSLIIPDHFGKTNTSVPCTPIMSSGGWAGAALEDLTHDMWGGRWGLGRMACRPRPPPSLNYPWIMHGKNGKSIDIF